MTEHTEQNAHVRRKPRAYNVPMSVVYESYIAARQRIYAFRVAAERAGNDNASRTADHMLDAVQDMLCDVERYVYGENSQFSEGRISASPSGYAERNDEPNAQEESQ